MRARPGDALIVLPSPSPVERPTGDCYQDRPAIGQRIVAISSRGKHRQATVIGPLPETWGGFLKETWAKQVACGWQDPRLHIVCERQSPAFPKPGRRTPPS